jgi:acyl-CoA thioesterase-2
MTERPPHPPSAANAAPFETTPAVAELLTMLDLERIEDNIFRGRSPATGWQRVFGGLVVAQALVASARTVEGRPPHSLHGYFLLPGDPQAPIVYDVDRLRDGRSFATRRCNAIQHGRAIFSLSASFHIDEPGFEHAVAMPDVPPPEALPSEAERVTEFGGVLPEAIKRWFSTDRPIETRPVDPSSFVRAGPAAPVQNVWLRAAGPLPDDPAIHRAVLAYLSDMTLLDTALIAHGHFVFDARVQVASLDHALWFHRPFRADEWLLYVQDSPNASGARGLTRGLLFARDGRLIASVMQEGLMRPQPA